MSVPKLRFPEFTDDWFHDVLSNHIKLISGMHLAPDEYDNSETEDKIPYFTGPSDFTNDISEIFKWTSKNKNFASRGDTLLTVKGSGVGQLMFLELAEVAMGRQLMAVSATPDTEKFIFYCLAMRKQYFEALGSGNMIPGIARTDILSTKITFPKSNKEQKKIADCLSSIDDRITLETQKLDTLKVHKKGLMQQLFPAEGKTLPKLRFPEFQDSGEWEVKKLEEVCDCIVPGRDKPKSFTGDIPWITIPDIQGLKIHSSINKLELSVHEIKECGAKIVPKNSVIMSCVGTFGLVSICDQDLVINQQLHAWIPSPKVNNYYLAYSLILQKKQMERMATNTTIAYLNKSSCNAITIPLPSLPEQQKIVDCLSSLDEAIAAQAQAIDTLKTHKKGLMQQLFPSVEEVKE